MECAFRNAKRVFSPREHQKMVYEVEKQLLNIQVRPHLKRWINKLNNPGPANKQLAERSVARLYKLYGKETPRIFWCDNPYQMAVIPPMMTFILQTSEWRDLYSKMEKHREDPRQSWDTNFEKAWRPFSKIFFRFSKQMSSAIFSVDAETRQSCREKIKTLFKQILQDLQFPAPAQAGVKTAVQLSQEWGFRSNVSDPDFLKRRLALQMKIMRSARLGQSLPLRTFVSAMSMTFAPELLLNLLPGRDESRTSESISELQYKLAGELKSIFSDYEARSATLSAWYASLPLSGRTRNFACTWLPCDTAFLPYALSCAFISESFFADFKNEIECWSHLSLSAAGYYFCKQFCFICPPPASIILDANSRPHNRDGAAAWWRDGYQSFAWKGQTIDPGLIRSRELITIKKIRSCHNIERRRLMIEIYGEERFINDAGASVVAEDSFGTLYKISLPRDETMAMVRVRNSTPEADGSYRNYYLRVPPDMQSARQAVAWTFGLGENEYSPEMES